MVGSDLFLDQLAVAPDDNGSPCVSCDLPRALRGAEQRLWCGLHVGVGQLRNKGVIHDRRFSSMSTAVTPLL